MALAAVVAAGIPGIWLVAAMAVYLAGLGLAMPQAMAGALTPFPDRAGTAASLMGLVQQTVAAAVAAVIGGYLGRSAWPVTGVVRRDGLPDFFALGGHAPASRATTLIGLRRIKATPNSGVACYTVFVRMTCRGGQIARLGRADFYRGARAARPA